MGPSWTILDAGLSQFPKDSYPEPYIINAFKCWPGNSKDEKTLPAATRACQQRTLDEIARYPRKVILALGNPAVWTTTNNFDLRITRARGKVYPSKLAERGIVAAVHPAFLMRGGGSFRQFLADVHYALRLLQGAPLKNPGDAQFMLLDTPELIEQFCNYVREKKVEEIVSDAETTGFDFRTRQIICMGYTVDGHHSYIVPVLDKPELVPFLRKIHSLPVRWVWHNGKFDIKFLHQPPYSSPAVVDEDTMLLSYANDEMRGLHDLEQASSDWLGSPNWKAELTKLIPRWVVENGVKRRGHYGDAPRNMLYLYLAKDLLNTKGLLDILRPMVMRDDKSRIQYTKSLIPGSAFLTRIEETGLYVDLQRVDENAERYEKEAAKYREILHSIYKDHTGEEAPPTFVNSPKQLAEFLYDVLRLEPKKKGSRSTDEDTLLGIKGDHPFVINLLKSRKVLKAKGTYVDPAKDNMSNDGATHSTYKLHGTATGRLSSSDPNLQNIPRDPILRGQFIARPGKVLLEVDLNQAELRSLATLSRDPDLIRIYSSDGLSIHEVIRKEIYGSKEEWSPTQFQKFLDKWYINPANLPKDITPMDRVLEEQKMRAKNVNFGIVYGITSVGLAEQIEDTIQEAARFLLTWSKRFPQAWEFIQLCRRAPVMYKNLVTVFGYRKRFGVVSPENLGSLQNEAANFPHQSTAALITLHAGIRLYERLWDEFRVPFVNTVHDSLIAEVDADEQLVRKVAGIIQNECERVGPDWGLNVVPFKAESKVGERWGSLKDLEKYYKAAA